MQGDKNTISKIYKDFRHSRLCSARLEATSGPRTKGVPTNNHRERVSGHCLHWGDLDKSRKTKDSHSQISEAVRSQEVTNTHQSVSAHECSYKKKTWTSSYSGCTFWFEIRVYIYTVFMEKIPKIRYLNYVRRRIILPQPLKQLVFDGYGRNKQND